MAQLITFAVLIAGVVVLTPAAQLLRLPQPVLLTVFGLLLALVPGVPGFTVTPSIILPVVLPPLLFAATQRTTLREFRESARPVLLLAVGLTIATAAVVAGIGHWAGGLEWAHAWLLGAIVSPPDPVAATAVARRLRLPHRLVTVLEGEGMFNDATALVLYKVAVVATVTGTVGAGRVAAELGLAVVVGLGLGIALGWLSKWALTALRDGASETTLTIVMPFVAYLVAERLHGSGVLAVLALGLFLRSYAHSAITATGYLLGRSVWRYLDFIITSLVFVLIGFELTGLLERSTVDASSLRLAGIVVGSVVIFRALWMFPAAWATRYHKHRRELESPYGWRETTVAAWAGMRGVVTVATAMALPVTLASGDDFVARPELLLIALCCVLATLVVQGLTLAPLVTLLKVGVDSNQAEEAAQLRRQAATAALAAVEEHQWDASARIHDAVVQHYQGYLSAQEALEDARDFERADENAEVGKLREALLFAVNAERDFVLQARRTGKVSAAAADEVLDGVEARGARDLD